MPLSIFQTWKSKDPDTFPQGYKKCQESWQRLHPGVSYKIYDDEENQAIISKYFPGKLEEVYNLAKKPVEKADIARCAILYLHGGLYADMDFMALKSHEDIFNSNDGIVVGSLSIPDLSNKWHVVNSIPNAWMMSKHMYDVFWLLVLDSICDRMTEDISDTEVKTGPGVIKDCFDKYTRFENVTEAVSSLKHMQNYITDMSLVKYSKITLLDPVVVYPNSWTSSDLGPNRDYFWGNDWDAICSKFPNSIAFTYWAHNW
jgi:mannosyltransferase OCH1-like enzyme